ncbi:MAG: T9SS type A sorting domain-containing protein [Bacteroidia bacterium]
MKFYISIFFLLFSTSAFAQSLSLSCETGTESGNMQYVYIYAANSDSSDLHIGAMTLLLAHQTHQQWQANSSWSITDEKWSNGLSREEDVSQPTGYGMGFSELFRCAQAAGFQDEPLVIPAYSKMMIARIGFSNNQTDESVYLVNPQEDEMVAIADENGKAIAFSVTSQPTVAGLPVDLVEFTAEQIGDRLAEIRWTSQVETQTEAYIVERSLDGAAFEVLKETPATGPGQYRLQDVNPYLPVTHYRLRWRDTDGQTGLTETLEVVFSEPVLELTVFPNPSNGMIEIQYGENLSVFRSISLIDGMGKMVFEQKKLPESLGTSFDLSGFPSGVYQIRGITENGEVVATSIIIR